MGKSAIYERGIQTQEEIFFFYKVCSSVENTAILNIKVLSDMYPCMLIHVVRE